MSNNERGGRHHSDRPHAVPVTDLQARLRRENHAADLEPSLEPPEGNDHDYDGGGSAA
ncbi:hypothetical protein [Nocardia iowensis]|uniref:Uncharacterized protein n=1 Tax=Nocardia iowensis TaxID=204891 RepID=A0ABX8RU03_NOCIO|nr:hypothetical protein [Nocardia iowensis]QXN91875.1 hypothetical protein KV110_01380 [Nocardia iowensis]